MAEPTPVADCLNPEAHSVNGGPFRYCPCGWMEDPEPVPDLTSLIEAVSRIDIRPLAIQQANEDLEYLTGMSHNWLRNGDERHGAMLQCLGLAFKFQQVENERLDLVNRTQRAHLRAVEQWVMGNETAAVPLDWAALGAILESSREANR
jgi:hypothetical protein